MFTNLANAMGHHLLPTPQGKPTETLAVQVMMRWFMAQGMAPLFRSSREAVAAVVGNWEVLGESHIDPMEYITMGSSMIIYDMFVCGYCVL